MPKILKTKKVKQTTNKQYKPIILYLVSVVKGVLVFSGGIILVAFLFMNSGNFNTFTKIMAYAIIFIGAFVSGFCSNRKIKGRGFLDGIISSLLYCVFISVVLIIIMRFNISMNILFVFLCGISGGIIGGIISANSK